MYFCTVGNVGLFRAEVFYILMDPTFWLANAGDSHAVDSDTIHFLSDGFAIRTDKIRIRVGWHAGWDEMIVEDDWIASKWSKMKQIKFRIYGCDNIRLKKVSGEIICFDQSISLFA